MRRAIGFAALFALALLAPQRAGAGSVLEFLYVEANEGDSSGGHVALRVGEEVFHFQFETGRTLRLVRDDWPHFRHVYGRLGNRRIHAQQVDAEPDTVALLRDAFARRLLEEDAEVRQLSVLRRDRMLLEAMGGEGDDAAVVLSVEGAGLFAMGGGATADVAAEPRLAALRARVVAAHGADFLARRRAHVAEVVLAQRPETRDADWIRALAAAPLVVQPGFAGRLEEALALRRAFEVLDEAPALAPAAAHAPEDVAFRLDAAELHAIENVTTTLEKRLLARMASPELDGGRMLLVGLARLATLARSLETGRLVFLDAYPADATRLEAGGGPAALAGFAAEAEQALRAARRTLVWSDSPDETEWSALETAANRLEEATAAAREGRPLRLATGALLPSRAALLEAPTLMAHDTSARAAAARRAREDEAAFTARFQARHPYALLTRNCVTEVFRGIDAAFAAAGEEPEQASRTRLGGWIDAAGFARFIPFVADAAVAAHWRIQASHVLPAEREMRIEAMGREERPLLVALRESNTLTSTAYTRHGSDSFFVFFTDVLPPVRPVLGAVNLLAGVGQALGGLLLLPFDGGRTLSAGASAALFSLPELAFLSVRKGTLAWAPARPVEAFPASEALAAE